MALASGWNGDLTKLKKDCQTIKNKRDNVSRIVFATSLTVSEDVIEKWRKAVKDKFDFELVDVIHHDWIVGELVDPMHRWIAHEYLNLPVGDFADLRIHLPRLKDAAVRMTAGWRQFYPEDDNPILDLRLIEEPADKSATLVLRRSELVQELRRGEVIWLVGQPGIGKTHTLLNAGEALLESSETIPLLVSYAIGVCTKADDC